MRGRGGVIGRALGIVWQSSPRWALANGACVILSATMPVLLLWAMGRVVDDVLGSGMWEDGDVWQGLRGIAPSLAVFGAALWGGYIVAALSEWCGDELGERIRGRVSAMTHKQMSRVSFQTMQSPKFQTEAFRAISGSTQRPVNIFLNTLSLTEATITFCAMSVWLIRVCWWLPLIVILAGLPVVAVNMWDLSKSYKLYMGQSDDERKAQYYNRVLTQPRYSPEIRLFGLWDFFSGLYDALHHKIAGERLALERRNVLHQVVTITLQSVAVVAVFVIVIFMTIGGGLSVGSLAMYLMAIRRAEAAATIVAKRTVALHRQGLYIRSLFDFLDVREDGQQNSLKFPTDFRSIEIKNASFAYPGSERQAISGVSISIKRGEVVGIAGGNGSGKSTIVKMLSGLLRPDEGSVAVDDVEIADMSREEVTAHIATVFQDFCTYNASAADNIHFGDMGSELDRDRMRKAAADTDIDQLIDSLPEEYDTQLGSYFSGSEMFSRGEWQRMAMARVIYSQADIMIFDEAASALDPRARATLKNNISRLREAGKTIIIVSHLEETLAMADRVIELKKPQA